MREQSAHDETFYVVQARHVRQCLKEARVVIVIWALGLVYCSTVIAVWGYLPPEQRPEVPPMVWGIPAWVFWGLFFPWMLLIVATWWFAVGVLRDDEPFMEFPGDDDSAKPGADGPSRHQVGPSEPDSPRPF